MSAVLFALFAMAFANAQHLEWLRITAFLVLLAAAGLGLYIYSVLKRCLEPVTPAIKAMRLRIVVADAAILIGAFFILAMRANTSHTWGAFVVVFVAALAGCYLGLTNR